MEFYDVIDQRRTVREFLDKEVDFEAIKRILQSGNKAPTWNHNRNWSFIILRTDEEKEYALRHYSCLQIQGIECGMGLQAESFLHHLVRD